MKNTSIKIALLLMCIVVISSSSAYAATYKVEEGKEETITVNVDYNKTTAESTTKSETQYTENNTTNVVTTEIVSITEPNIVQTTSETIATETTPKPTETKAAKKYKKEKSVKTGFNTLPLYFTIIGLAILLIIMKRKRVRINE